MPRDLILDFEELAAGRGSQSLLNLIPQETLLVLLAYGLLGSLYLVVVPLALYAWMNKRWHRMGKVERLGIYGKWCFCFPWDDCLRAFLNFRLSGQGDS